MKRVVIGCIVSLICLFGLNALRAQDSNITPAPDFPTEITATDIPTLAVESATPVPTATAIPTEAVLPTDISLTTTEPIVATDETDSNNTSAPTATLTQSIIVLPTLDLNVTALPSQTPPATPTLALRAINGQALYPNRALGQAFIRVQAFAGDGSVLSTAYTDANGLYSLAGMADQVTRVQIDAPLYLPETLYLAPGITPPVVTLRGGDLDGDACVGPADIALLSQHYDEAFIGADLDGNGRVDVVDLTLLSGNYDAACVPAADGVTPTAIVPVATDEATPSETTLAPTEVSTAEVLVTEEVVVTETPAPTATEIVPPTATEIIVPTVTDTLPPVEPTTEATGEA